MKANFTRFGVVDAVIARHFYLSVVNNNNNNNNKTIFIQVNLFSKNEFAAINQGPVNLMYLRYKSYNNIV